MKAVIIGAGRIGCGLAGELLHASGYELVFVTRTADTAAALNRFGRYRVILTDKHGRREVTVPVVCALDAGETESIIQAIAAADVIVTAVCAQNLAAIAPLIAAGLSRRSCPANVLAFENMDNAGPHLRRLVRSAMLVPRDVNLHGFSGAVISRMVTQRIAHASGDQPLTFVGDSAPEFVVHGPALRGPLPSIQGMTAVDDYYPWVLRKLYTFSAGHATAAYLGWLKGYHYIHTAIRDAEIRSAVLTAMAEGQSGLAARYGSQFAGCKADLEKIVERFENAVINDPVTRVARDPHRKLGAKERLVGAARLAEEAGIFPQQLAMATAAALCFRNAEGRRAGDDAALGHDAACVSCVLNQVCGLDSNNEFCRKVAISCEQLAPSYAAGNLLLSLTHPMWSWAVEPGI